MVASGEANDQISQGVTEHPVTDIIQAVEASHKGLGRLAAFSLIASKAQKCLIVIAPPGCGKSAVGEWIEKVHPEAYRKQSITRSALKLYEELFNNFTGCVIFDDVGAIDTKWSREQTLVTMAEIVYGHFVSKDSHQLHIEIDDFYGSAILNIQPNVLKEVVEMPSWHSNLADKSIRYYHLMRATRPNPNKIEVEADWGLPFNDIDVYDGDSPLWDAILNIGLEQWSLPRSMEHCHDLLRAVAALGRNPQPGLLELEILLALMRPLTVEMELIERQGFGSKATLNDNLLYILVEFATYFDPTYDQIAKDYFFKPSQVYRILEHMISWFEKIDTNPVRLQPSARMEVLLQRAGIL